MGWGITDAMNYQPLRDNRRVLTASLVGTTVEYYDFFIYGTAAALFFGPLFFPSYSPAAQTLLSFMSFGIAFIARPFGALAFGHYGDRIGRKSTLVASLLLMGASTLLIAFLPTYAMARGFGAGWIAPTLLCVLRFGQGFGLGGEWTGASLLAVENAPQGWAGRFGAVPQLGIPIGFIAANGTFLLLGLTLSDADLMAWGWRVPFLASAVLVAFGLWIRLRISETPAFQAALEQDAPEPVPLLRLLRDHPGAILAGSAGAVCTYAVFYLATSFALAQAAGALGYARESFLAVQLAASVCFIFSNIVAGQRADRTSPARTLMFGAIAVMFAGLLFGPALASGSLVLAGAMLCLIFLVLGFVNSPLGAWMSSLFPVRVRYSGVAFSHNLGGIIGGALTPLAAQVLSASGNVAWTGLLLSGAGALTIAGVTLAPRRRH